MKHRHIYRFDYPIDKDALRKEKILMDSASDTTFHVVNTDLLEQVNEGRNTREDLFPTYHDFEDKEHWDNMDTWTIRGFSSGRTYLQDEIYNECNEIKRITNELTSIIGSAGGDEMVPYFMIQDQKTIVPMHIDMGFSTAINLIVDGENTPVIFRDEKDGEEFEYYYDNALMNVCNYFHSVPEQQNAQRLVLKFRIKDVSYDDALNKMMEYFGDSQT